jgi:hypothetical protein
MKDGLAPSMYTESTSFWSSICILKIASHCSPVYGTLQHAVSVYGYLFRGEDVLGLRVEDRVGGGVNIAILSCFCFSCLVFSALSATSAIIPIVTNTEKIKASIDGIISMTNFPEFIL